EEISLGKLNHVIPIVCSWKDSTETMLDCMNKGAVDYLLKPIRLEVAKTMFLRMYRSDHSKSSIRCSGSLEQRIQKVIMKDKWLEETIFDYYTPPKPSMSVGYIARLNPAAELEKTNSLKRKLSEWEFNAHELTEEDQLRCVVIIFEHVLEYNGLRVSTTNQLHQFIFAIMKCYHNTNPYHNFIHAVDVLQAMFHFLCKIDLIPSLFPSRFEKNRQRCFPDNLLKSTDAFALLLASIGHDVGHPGVSNNFLIQSQTPLAQIYNDTSVLESFHAMTLFNLMRKHDFMVYNPGTTEYAELRKTVVNAILATDMDLHEEYVVGINEQIKRFQSPDYELKADKERKIIFGALIKCADISNVARPYHIAESWSNVLMEEFRCQGDLQRKLGQPVPPLNDRHGSITQSDSQIWFIDFFAMPLFTSVGNLLP
ncbi:5572_t:CDS:2, partial [Acaulospora morrowiae]